MDNLHALPKFRDNLTILYLERGRIDRYEHSVAFHDAQGITPIPAASLAVLMLGPGTVITQAAIAALADNNCLIIWCGEENVRFYAAGIGGTRSARGIIAQARLASDPHLRLQVVMRMYRMRFNEPLAEEITLQQLRGKEGLRVRMAYQQASQKWQVAWQGRSYDRSHWGQSDPINRALSAANACLYGLCHAAILSAGFSPALGFIHTGKQLSFVYDIADLYKTEVSIPAAFQTVAESPLDIERRVRYCLRDYFRQTRLVQRIIPDIFSALGLSEEEMATEDPYAEDPALPSDWWDPENPQQTDWEKRLL